MYTAASQKPSLNSAGQKQLIEADRSTHRLDGEDLLGAILTSRSSAGD
jgi:hypothetical protein